MYILYKCSPFNNSIVIVSGLQPGSWVQQIRLLHVSGFEMEQTKKSKYKDMVSVIFCNSYHTCVWLCDVIKTETLWLTAENTCEVETHHRSLYPVYVSNTELLLTVHINKPFLKDLVFHLSSKN